MTERETLAGRGGVCFRYLIAIGMKWVENWL